MKIVVRQDEWGYLAELPDSFEVVGRGSSAQEAVGQLVVTQASMFGHTVEIQKNPPKYDFTQAVSSIRKNIKKASGMLNRSIHKNDFESVENIRDELLDLNEQTYELGGRIFDDLKPVICVELYARKIWVDELLSEIRAAETSAWRYMYHHWVGEYPEVLEHKG